MRSMGRPVRATIGAALVLTTAAACTSSSPGPHAAMTITPARALFDTPVEISVSDVTPGQRVTFTALANDAHGVSWKATAVIRADAHGRAATTGASTAGSYRGVNAMGLFELQRPVASDAMFFAPPAGKWTVHITAAVDGHRIADSDATRLVAAQAGVRRHVLTLARTGVYGELFLPPRTATPHPAVLTFGGSGGGLTTSVEASLLAAHGYPSLALAYFGEPGLPAHLDRIPLEYFARALRLLAAAPGVDPRRVLVWGPSRGSEAALLLGVHYPTLVHGVIALVPSSVVNGSFPGGHDAAWTWQGRPIPYAPLADFRQPDPADAQDAVIPVQRIEGPVFTVCGGQDAEWPSCAYSAAITARLADHSHFVHVALAYPTAGHQVGQVIPYLPAAVTTSVADVQEGGTVVGNAEGQAAAWPRLLAFLAKA